MQSTVLLGELGLDGRVRPVHRVRPAMLAAAQAGFTPVVVPVRQAGESQLVEGLEVLGVGSLNQLVAVFRGDPVPEIEPIEVAGKGPPRAPDDSWTWPTWWVRGRSRWQRVRLGELADHPGESWAHAGGTTTNV